MTSVIVVNWNTRDLLRACLASIRLHLSQIDHEVIVVDNDSADGSSAMVRADFPHVRLIDNDENVGFARANNQGMREARGDLLLLLNADTELTDASVAQLAERVLADDGIGVAHCRLLFPDGRVQHSAYRFPSLALTAAESFGLYKLLPRRRAGELLLSGYWSYDEERDVDWVAGAFMLVRREVYEATGGFDERSFMYGEDLEWCLRINDRGWRIRYFPSASIIHADHSSSNQRWDDRQRLAIIHRTQRQVYRDRHGALSTSALMALRAAGAALRLPYYSLRRALGGARAEAYGRMQRASAISLRVLVPLVFGRG